MAAMKPLASHIDISKMRVRKRYLVALRGDQVGAGARLVSSSGKRLYMLVMGQHHPKVSTFYARACPLGEYPERRFSEHSLSPVKRRNRRMSRRFQRKSCVVWNHLAFEGVASGTTFFMLLPKPGVPQVLQLLPSGEQFEDARYSQRLHVSASRLFCLQVHHLCFHVLV